MLLLFAPSSTRSAKHTPRTPLKGGIVGRALRPSLHALRSTLFALCLALAAPAFAQFTSSVLISPDPQDERRFGKAVANAGDVDNDGVEDYIIGSEDDVAPAVNGAAYIFSGADNSLIRTLISPNPESNGNFGETVSGIWDLNGDDYFEVIVGASGEDGGATNAGRAYVFSGIDGSVLYTLESPNPETDGQFGYQVADAYYVDADAVKDILISAFDEDGGAINAGRVYVFSGATGGLLHTLESPTPEISGGFGAAIGNAGNVNGDGSADVIVGASAEDGGGFASGGKAHLFSGFDGSFLRTLVSPFAEFSGGFGFSVAGLNDDLNNDGFGDVVVGAPLETNVETFAGRAYVMSGATCGLIFPLKATVPEGSADFGHAVAWAGDVNDDGADDILIGAPNEEGVYGISGKVYVFSGANGSLLHYLHYPTVEDGADFGFAVAYAGDINNDDLADIIIGADDEDSAGIDGSGAAYVFISTPCTFTSPNRMYWSEATPSPDRIAHAELDGSDIQSAVNNIDPVLIALDANNQMLYWTDSERGLVQRGPICGGPVETIAIGVEPFGIDLDLSAGKVYWSESGKIRRADLNGANAQDLFTGLPGSPSGAAGLALDVDNGKIYWMIGTNTPTGLIQRGNMDGTGSPETLLSIGQYPWDITLDVSGGKMYWTELNAMHVARADLDGANDDVLLTDTALLYGVALDLANNQVYFSGLNGIRRRDISGGTVEFLALGSGSPIDLELDVSGGATTTFAGMTNTSLGGASMSLDLDNHLVISNLGASGLDGVSFFLGQAQFGELDFGSTLALSPGAFVQASAIGSLNNVPGQTIGTIRFTGVSGGNTNVQFDLSAVSVQGPDYIVYNGATQVFRGTVPGNSVEVAGHPGPCWIPFQPQSASGGGANALATVFLRQKFAISIPGGPTVTGDRIVALAENITASVEYVSDISVIGANLSSFTLEAEALGLFNTNLHEAAGSAQITSIQQPASLLTVSNLGASLLDGVDIDLEEAGIVTPCFLVGLAGVPLSGVNEQVHFEAVSPASSTPFGAVDLLATGSGFEVNVDYAPIGSSMVEVMVFNAGVPVGSAIVPAGTVGTITPTPNPITLTSTFVEAAGAVAPSCMRFGFAQPVSFAFASTANSSPNPLLLGRERGFGSPLFSREGSGVSSDDSTASSNVSFWKNLPSHSEETSEQDGGANAREGPYRMTNTEDAATSSSVSG